MNDLAKKQNIAAAVVFVMSVFSMPLGASPASEALRTQAMIEFQEKNYSAAIAKLDEALQLDSADMKSRYFRGMSYLKLEKYGAAAKDLATVTVADEIFPGLHLNLGYAQYKNGDYAAAVNNLQKATAEQPQDATAHYYLGLAYQSQTKFAQSLTPLRQAMMHDDQFDDSASYFIGVALYREGRSKDALEALKAMSAKFPNSSYAKSAENLVTQIETEKVERRRHALRLEAGLTSDSNVGLFPGEDTEIYTVAQRDDMRSFIDISAEYDVVKKEQTQTSLGGAYNMSRHADLSAYDVDSLTFYLDHTKDKDSSLWNVRVGYRQSSLEGEAYTSGFFVVPSFMLSHQDSKVSMIRLTWSDTDYEQDGHLGLSNYTGEAHYRLITPLDKTQPQQVYLGGRFKLVNTSDAAYDYTSYGIEGGYETNLSKGLFTSYARYDDRSYSDSTRTQQLLELGLAYDHPITRSVFANASFRYLDSGSNLAFYQYDRTLVSVSIRWQQ